MNDFDFEVKEKKRIARGAYNRKRGSRSRKCTLPSDYLSAAQKKGLNGEMAIYNLSKPMSYATFKIMPEDLQREYIDKLRLNFCASTKRIAGMMGCANETLRQRMLALGYNTHRNLRPSAQQDAQWREWLGGSKETDESDAPDVIPAAGGDNQPENCDDAPVGSPCAIHAGMLDITGSARQVLDTISTMLSVVPANRLKVRIEFTALESEVAK